MPPETSTKDAIQSFLKFPDEVSVKGFVLMKSTLKNYPTPASLSLRIQKEKSN